ncbi:MAG TPA: vitamin K epoxide reductase family protein [Streptosporangiaceae bacterium]|nr:vitamin K epoxide reductase family protein [Streptosporangiaceae bacterium]
MTAPEQARGTGQPVAQPGDSVPDRRAAAAEPSAAGVGQWLRTHPFQVTTWILALIALGVSTYLTIEHYANANPACPDTGLFNCVKVTTSQWSIVFGIFPVAVLGLAFYAFMAVINSPWAWRANGPAWLRPAIYWSRLGSICVGMLFVLYLIWAEVVQVGSICPWCTSVHVITFALFMMLVFHASGKSDRDAALGRTSARTAANSAARPGRPSKKAR